MDNTNHYQVLIICITCLATLRADNCNIEPLSKTLRFTLQSRRNLTGHWIAEVQLEHGDAEVISGRSWEIGVEQSVTTACGGQLVSVAATVSGPPPRPPPDYEFFPGMGYYKLHKEGRKWTEAMETCARENAHLAVLNSQQESDILKAMFGRHPKYNNVDDQTLAFIGFHDLFREGEFITVLGTSLNSTGFLIWSDPSQPNNSKAGPDPDSDCGSISRNGGMNDVPCNWKLTFFCEQEIW